MFSAHYCTELIFVAGITEEGNADINDNSGNDDDDKEKEAEIAKDSKLSDMDYLKSKVISTKQKMSKTRERKKSQNNKRSDSGNEEETDRESDDEETVDNNRGKISRDNSDSEDANNDDDDEEEDEDDGDDSDGASGKDDDDDVDDNGHKNLDNRPQESTVFGTIKMRGLPFKAKEQHIKDFFAPLRILNIRIIKNAKGKPTGCAFVDFANAKDIKEALKRDRDCIEGRYIELFRDNEEQSLNQQTDKEKPWMKKFAAQEGDEEFESIAEVSKNVTFMATLHFRRHYKIL